MANPTAPPSPAPPPSPPPSSPPSPPPVGWDDDLLALTLLYETSDGAVAWERRNNWLKVHPCSRAWHGVQCARDDDDDNRVTRLVLPELGLVGTLPTELAQLAFVREVSLYGNALSGTVPTQLGALEWLERLLLAENAALSGTLPLFRSGRLSSLRVSHTALSGSVPAPSASLRALHLAATLLSGALPTQLGLAPLESVHATASRLSGTLPTQLGSTPLQHAHIDSAALSGTLPTALGNCSGLARLSLRHNALSGSVPLELGGRCERATAGAALDLRGNPMTSNDLAATLPTDIRDLTSHDLCALAAGPVSVELGRSGATTSLDGGLLEPPSLRAAAHQQQDAP